MKTRSYEKGLQERLKDKNYAVGYLTEVLSKESPNAFLIALNDIMNVRELNKSEFSEEAGITRQTLYKALSKTGNPRLSTVLHILKVLGFNLTITN